MGRQEDTQEPARPRLVGLDLLRLIAVLLVIGRHMGSPPIWWPDLVRLPLLALYRGGWVGVDLFFVLSGFLVSGLLFTEFKSRGRLGVVRFFTRRGWKIYPPFFVFIVTTVVVRLLCGWPVDELSLLSELFFLQSYIPGLWHHTWSLAVEEHFYLLLPFTFSILLRVNRNSPTPLKPILTLAVVTGVALLALRVLNWYYRPSYEHLTHLFPTHLRLDSLFYGVAISYAYHFHSDRFVRCACAISTMADSRWSTSIHARIRSTARSDSIPLHVGINRLCVRQRNVDGRCIVVQIPRPSLDRVLGDAW